MNIGIIITAYNRPEYLDLTLNSLKASSMPRDYKLIIIDDCSTDPKAREIIDSFEFPNTVKVQNITRLGGHYATAMQKYWDELYADGCDILCNFDSDTIIGSYWFDKLSKLLFEFPRSMITGFNTDAHETLLSYQDYVVKKDIGGINLFFNRELWPILRDITFNGMWDWNMCKVLNDNKIAMIAARPSVVRHIGIVSTLGHTGADISAD